MVKKSLIAFHWFLVAVLATLSFFPACKKGNLIEGDHYMKFSLDAFFADTALFSVVKLNDTVLAESTIDNHGRLFNLANAGQGIARTDSARLRVTVVKKNAPNVSFDSVIYLSRFNDFLLLQLNPTQRPLLINKALENATAIQPGKDSIKLRFFFNNLDEIRRKDGTLSESITLQLFITEKITDGYYKTPVSYITIRDIKINTLSNYISFYTGNPNIRYGFQLRDVKTNEVLQKYKFVREDGIMEGSLDFESSENFNFRTLRINKSEKFGDWTGEVYTAFNANYMFGLN